MNKNITSFPSLASVTKTLKLCLKMPTFNVDDPDHRLVFYFFFKAWAFVSGSLGYRHPCDPL